MTSKHVSLVEQRKLDAKVAKKKGYLAAAVGVAGATATVALTPWLGVPVMGYGIFLGGKWFLYRIEKGLRF